MLRKWLAKIFSFRSKRRKLTYLPPTWTWLCLAIYDGAWTIMYSLIRNGASTDFSEAENFCPLRTAIERDEREIFDFLLDLDTNCDIVNMREENNGLTPLQIAARYGRRYMITKLLSRGADLNDLSTRGNMDIFQVAASTHDLVGDNYQFRMKEVICIEHQEFMKWFLTLGNFNIDYSLDKGLFCGTPSTLESVLTFGDEELLRTLMEKRGLNLAAFSPGDIRKLLCFAATNPDTNVFQFVADRTKFDVDEFVKMQKVVEIGLTDVSEQVVIRDTFLRILIKLRNPELVDYLLDIGANLRCKKFDDCTSLYLAIESFEVDCVWSLLLNGAELDDGEIPMIVFSNAYRNGGRIAETLQCYIKYIAFLQMQNKDLKESVNLMRESIEFANFIDKCRSELLTMQKHYVYKSVSIYDLLVDPCRFQDLLLDDTFESETNPEKFPIYSDMLLKRFRIERKKYDLYERAVLGLKEILILDQHVFHLVYKTILKHLSYRDLRTLSLIYPDQKCSLIRKEPKMLHSKKVHSSEKIYLCRFLPKLSGAVDETHRMCIHHNLQGMMMSVKWPNF